MKKLLLSAAVASLAMTGSAHAAAHAFVLRFEFLVFLTQGLHLMRQGEEALLRVKEIQEFQGVSSFARTSGQCRRFPAGADRTPFSGRRLRL